MTNSSPIPSPPPELKELWINDGPPLDQPKFVAHYVADQAAQWGWDQRGAATEAELQETRDEEREACCKWLTEQTCFHPNSDLIKDLRAARRPSPPSLAQKALHILGSYGDLSPKEHDTIRKTLEQLP